MDFSTPDKHRDTVPPTNIAIRVLMMQIDEFHRKNTWDDVRTPPRKIRFLLKIHTAGMDFSTPDKHRDTEHHLENSISIENPYRRRSAGVIAARYCYARSEFNRAPPPDSTSDYRTQQQERLVFGAPRGPDLPISKIQILNFRVRSTLDRIERMIERMIERNNRVLEQPLSNNVASCPRSQVFRPSSSRRNIFVYLEAAC
ncbi:hypothetical protein PAPYR_13117 [Paratrimastix pyriformis]|uniref:Uncharacterized protein n=1 Tax=Paratrimastix pyriformis TaxID=342808 RepID=A0ABQ8U515_9EUKA|nr:hypothetical protein PAPYR_13117 [Paratrimastix pyriformis]